MKWLHVKTCCFVFAFQSFVVWRSQESFFINRYSKNESMARSHSKTGTREKDDARVDYLKLSR